MQTLFKTSDLLVYVVMIPHKIHEAHTIGNVNILMLIDASNKQV